MKNTRNNNVLLLWLLLSITNAVFAATTSFSDVAESGDYLALIRKLPRSWQIEPFKGQSFVSNREGIHFAAGVARGEDLPGKSDCFLYTKREGKEAMLTFLSKRAEDLWYCIGNPALSLRKYSNGSESIFVLLSIFDYQAPSGEIFKFPLILSAKNSSNFELGPLNDCVDLHIHGVVLRQLSQLDESVQKCSGMQRESKVAN